LEFDNFGVPAARFFPISIYVSLLISAAHPRHPAPFVAASVLVQSADLFPFAPFVAASAPVLAAYLIPAALFVSACASVLVAAPISSGLFAFVFVPSLAVLPGAFVPADAASDPAPVAVQFVSGLPSLWFDHHRIHFVDFDPSHYPFGIMVLNAFTTIYAAWRVKQSGREFLIISINPKIVIK
jgi:hypothetical protein